MTPEMKIHSITLFKERDWGDAEVYLEVAYRS